MFNKIVKLHDGSFIVYPGIGEYSEIGFNVTLDYPTIEQYGEKYTFGFVEKYAQGHPEMVEIAPVPYEPSLEEKQEQWKIALKSQYDAERVRLGTLLLMADDEEEKAEIKAQKEELKVKYEEDLKKVEKGIDPFE